MASVKSLVIHDPHRPTHYRYHYLNVFYLGLIGPKLTSDECKSEDKTAAAEASLELRYTPISERSADRDISHQSLTTCRRRRKQWASTITELASRWNCRLLGISLSRVWIKSIQHLTIKNMLPLSLIRELGLRIVCSVVLTVISGHWDVLTFLFFLFHTQKKCFQWLENYFIWWTWSQW